jgi:N6-adenosine-specific RNA methylase IME4
LAEPRPGYYRAILADPPWTFSTYSRKGKGRSAESHYDCLSLDQIKAIRVDQWAAPDCVLFMWSTEPMLPQALHVIKWWGFAYKTFGFTWIKHASRPAGQIDDPSNWPIGTGYWTRANPEPCLLATRGRPQRLSRSVRELIVSPRREHSRKPDEAYDRIEALCPGPYLELFGRFDREGWDRWGLEDGIGARRWASNSYPEAAE